ncbi:MAG TPA: Vacuolar H+transporting two-sector ATPase F subunit [Gammaproteobacteria bacterium]|nr:Vacuolar H+transporting two-sector ATPase F subunit [Gammaproteobacteria bacterium]
MAAPLFIGDPLTAAGYRLAGARVHLAAGDDDPAALLAWGLEQTGLLILGADFAQRLPEPELRAALRHRRTLVVTVPDAGGHAAPPDLAAWLRGQLGVGA